MAVLSQPDTALVARLPLPLAQLYRRTFNAKTALERHQAAYYLWEAALKLLGSTAVVLYARHPDPDPALAALLEALARPQVGHWWGIVRDLSPALAARGDAGFAKVAAFLGGDRRDDLPHLAGLDAALADVPTRATVSPRELFDRLVAYRNRAVGHGALGMHTEEVYERVGSALRTGLEEMFAHLDPLAGRSLVYVGDVKQTGGRWLIERFALAGEAPSRLPSLDLPKSAASNLPDGDRLYLQSGDDPAGLVALHPLGIFDFEAGQVYFLNARRGKSRVQYLCYTTGDERERSELAGDRRELLARALQLPVNDGMVAAWEEKSRAEEGSTEAETETNGKRLGEFDLISELGRGGMGVVYRAWQPSLRRQVALKTLLRVGDVTGDARFRREIMALGRVDHPNLVKIFTSGHDGERWFYAMELVEGASLAAVAGRLSRGETVDAGVWHTAVGTACENARAAELPLARDIGSSAGGAPEPDLESLPAVARGNGSPDRAYVDRIVDLLRQVAEAAHALHQAGIVHRDVKPGNVLVSRDGMQAVLMDLGLAQIEDDQDGLTKTRFLGTPRYASPEQVLSASKLDRRTDVYSLGATMWELLALRPLYGANESTPKAELMRTITLDEPERLRRLNAAVSRDLEAVVHKCLEKNPKARYATAGDMATDLRHYLAGEPVTARPVTGLVRMAKWMRRRPALAAAAILGVLMLVGMTLGLAGLVLWQRSENLRLSSDQLRQQEADRHLAVLLQDQSADEREYRTHLAASRFGDASKAAERALARAHGEMALADREADLQRQLEIARKLDDFLALSTEAWFFVGDEDTRPGVATRWTAAALQRLGILDGDGRFPKSDWWNSIPDAGLTANQRADLQEEVSQLLLLLALTKLRDGATAVYHHFEKNEPTADATAAASVTSAIDIVGHVEAWDRARRRPPAKLERSMRRLGQFILDAQVKPFRQMLAELFMAKPPTPDATGGEEPVRGSTEAFLDGDIHFYLREGKNRAMIGMLEKVLDYQLDAKDPLGRAQEQFLEAVRLHPTSYWAYYMLGLTFVSAGNPRGAELAYSECVRLRPRGRHSYQGRALALIERARAVKGTAPADKQMRDSLVRQGLDDVDRAVRLDPTAADNYWTAGTAHQTLGNDEEAIQSFARAIDLEDSLLLERLMRRGFLDKTETYMRELLAKDPQKANARALLAWVLYRLEKSADAGKEADAALRVSSKQPWALTVRGCLALAAGKTEPAAADLEAARQCGPPSYLTVSRLSAALEPMNRIGALSVLDQWVAAAKWATGSNAMPLWQARDVELARARLLSATPASKQAAEEAARRARELDDAMTSSPPKPTSPIAAPP
jgi:serine/threonine protein kinase/Tfp pilus assembly protein PilF